MRHMIFFEAERYPIALLTRPTAFNNHELKRYYLEPLNQRAVASDQVIGFTLEMDPNGKASMRTAKAYLEQLLPTLDGLGTQYLYVTDGTYFKALTKERKAEPHYGYVLPCAVKGFEHMQVVLGVNYQALIYNPDLQARLDLTLKALADALNGQYKAIGADIIKVAHYPKSVSDIAAALDSLHHYPELTIDTETFSLRVNKAGIGSIGFAWNQHEGVSFLCDYRTLEEPTEEGYYGEQIENAPVRRLIREFFETYQGKMTWHNSSFDLRCVIWALFMDGPLDREGMLHGVDVMSERLEDTKVIAYLATNSTAGNHLSLKDLAQEFAGNYAQDDIKDIRRIPPDELLRYNLIDCLATWYVANTYRPKMIADDQEEIYRTLMLPSLKVIAQMELTGMPMDQAYVHKARQALEKELRDHLNVLLGTTTVKQFTTKIQRLEMDKANAKLKTKQHPLSHFADVQFNPNSGPQLQMLLYEDMGLPVIDLTDKKQPATGAKTLAKLVNHTDDAEAIAILQALIGYGKANKILSAFIPNFEAAIDKGDGVTWLHGSFNLNGTVSGRLSASDPNLQQIPSGSTYGKLIKKCFRAPEGWLFSGADFNSLEDYISALTTKDPNKLKVYSGLKQYDITINGKTHRINEEDVVSYDGVGLTGEELDEKLQNSQP